MLKYEILVIHEHCINFVSISCKITFKLWSDTDATCVKRAISSGKKMIYRICYLT